MRNGPNQQKLTLLFVWGILLFLVSARLFFWRPVVLPKNSYLEMETEVSQVFTLESSQKLSVGDVTVFAPLYPKIRVGDRINIQGKVDLTGTMLDPQIKIIEHKENFSGWLWDLRQKIVGKVETLLPAREATLVAGTVLGVDRIGRDFRNDLIKTGTIHVVVVSGQNLSIVAGVFLALVKYLGRRGAMVLAIAACSFYAFLTGFEAPVVRALLMVIVTTLALFFGRATTAIFSLFAASMAIIFVWPAAITSISFQLTFAATLGIVTLGAYLQKLMRVPVAGEITAVCVGAFTFTAPVILYHFGSVSLLSPFVNILVSEAVFPIMILGFVLSALSLVYMPAAQLLSYVVFMPAHYFVRVVELFAEYDTFYVRGFGGSAVYFVLFAALILGLVLIWKGYSREGV